MNMILDTKEKVAAHNNMTGETRKLGDTVRQPHDHNVAVMIKAERLPKASARQVGGNHYMKQAIQPWAAMESWMTADQFAGFLRGNAIKYLARCDAKGGLEDLKKAQHYLEKLIEVASDD